MKKKLITLTITFLVAFTAFGQSITLTPSDFDQLQIKTFGNSTVPYFSGFRGLGTTASPLPIEINKTLAGLAGYGYNGSGFSSEENASILLYANQTFTPTANGTYIRFRTTANNTTTLVERMRISDVGNVGIGTATPTSKLEVNSGTTMGIRSISTTNVGIEGRSNSTNGVAGYSGTNNGVYGESTNGTGVFGKSINDRAILGVNNSATAVTATISNDTQYGTALELNGSLKVFGPTRTAFRVTSTGGFTVPISNTTTVARAATDMLFITRTSTAGTGTNLSYYANWNGTSWEIIAENNTAIPAGIVFNVLVIKQ